jgi:2-polyprenyl-3-methyl-5-hydroxy-6-metoxy-1,4-benzoquinol methylase
VFARRHFNANFRESIDDYEPAYRQYLDESPVDESNVDDLIAWMESHVSLTHAATCLLDVGAGSGKLIRRLNRVRPCGVSGIEPSGVLYDAYNLEALGVESITLPQLARRTQAAYDVVTVLDVIEHVPEAAEFVAALATVTKPGGHVFLSTPDAGGIPARLLGRRWQHYNSYHFSLYNTQAMAEAARRGGFRIVSTEHRAKRMALSYLWRRALDLQLAGGGRSQKPHRDRVSIPVNFGDILSVVWRRT